ncbi:MAG: peptidase [Holophagaceae bacterium]|nr:peptidase [Holophagaceae bacterium]
MLRSLVLACLFLLGGVSGFASPERWFEVPKSPRLANYRIKAALDWPGRRVEGRETIVWRNAGTAPTSEFPLHLYLNAFKGPKSLFYKESWGQVAQPALPSSWGYCRLKSVRLDGQDLSGHFGEDESVYWVSLGRRVSPGDTIEVDIEWESRFPQIRSRSGWSASGDFLMVAQWFPKVGVYQGDRWACAAYHAFTEFFSDFGVYDVELSVPNGLLIAHCGSSVPQGNLDAKVDPERKGQVIYTIHAEDIHDFAWAAMPRGAWGYKKYVWWRDHRETQLFIYYRAANIHNVDRQFRALKAALKQSNEGLFPYPYPVFSVVDVPPDVDEMEYPTLVTSASKAFEPTGQRSGLEDTVIHEFAHQYFQGILASNEVEEPWLDEGFATWFTAKVLDQDFQGYFNSRRLHVGGLAPEWWDYWRDPSGDSILQPGYRMRDGWSYGRFTYAKPSLVLNQMEAFLGRPVMDQVMAAYAREMAFKHPTGKDFRRIAERVSGRDLGGFWRDFVEGTETLDIVIERVNTRESRDGGWQETPKGMIFAPPIPVAPGPQGSVTLQRRGGIQMPITLWVRLENRLEQRITWDGQDRWATFEFDSPVVAAILDPDGNYPMLKDRLHASYTQKPVRRGLHYWSQMVWGVLIGILQAVGLG